MYRVIKAADVKLEFQIASHYSIHPCMYRWKHTCSSPNKSVKSHLLISVFTPMVVNRSLIFFFKRQEHDILRTNSILCETETGLKAVAR